MRFIYLLILACALTSCGRVIYRMPDGALCKNRYENTASQVEFDGCNNGRTYINPQYYSELDE